jgi:hypothetical protein
MVRDMRERTVANLIIPVFSTVVALLIGEGIIRLLGETDENGQFYFMERPLGPYGLVAGKSTLLVDEYLQDPTSYIVYSENLGWSIRPNAQGKNGLYRSNSAGIRSDVEYEQTPTPGVLRIALFGDSYTHGDHVSLEDSWGYQLEKLLHQEGIHAEVINFGVGGYGMDQAYLRWQTEGRHYQPDIVLFGFQAENAFRNANVIRSIYRPGSGIPFSKPKFVITGDSLTLVNSPTIPPKQMPELMATFGQSPLAEHEYFFNSDPNSYDVHWWTKSKLLTLALDVFATKEEDDEPASATYYHRHAEYFAMDDEPAQLTIAIVQAFRAGVEADGAEFIIVHLPRRTFLKNIRKKEPLPYADLLAYLDEHYDVVHTEDGMTELPAEAYFGKHLSVEGNLAVATTVAAEICRRRPSSPDASAD